MSAQSTRSSAPLAGPAQRSGEDFKKGALPGIVEFKEAQRRDPTWLAAEAWTDDKDAAAALLAPLPKKVVTWIKQRKFTHDENGLLLAAVGDEDCCGGVSSATLQVGLWLTATAVGAQAAGARATAMAVARRTGRRSIATAVD